MPARDQGSQLLEPLVGEFEAATRRKAAAGHTQTVIAHVRRVLAGCKVATLADLNAKDLASRVETFVWSLTEGDDPLSPPTAAYVGKHARQFTRWLWRKRKLLDFDPLAGVDLPSQEVQQKRRPLTPEELATLFDTVQKSPREFRGLSGPDRAVLYLAAVATGYRAGELAKLTPANFLLDAEVPVVRLKKEQTKNKKPVEQPLPPAVADRFRGYLDGKQTDQAVWPGKWSARSADMLKLDLADAGIALVVDDEHALFHSLRHSYTTLLAQNAPVKVVQELARHSTPVLTIGRYSHAGLKEKAEAVARLPILGAGKVGQEGGLFAGMPRAELEAVAEGMLMVVLTLWDTPRDTPVLDSAGDAVGPAGKESPQGRRPNKK